MSNPTTSFNVLMKDLYIKRIDAAKDWLEKMPYHFDSYKQVGPEERLNLAILFSTLERTLREIDKVLKGN